jgi:3-methyladenine DNA glycosylase Mpg
MKNRKLMKFVKKFSHLIGKTKSEIISKFGNSYVYSDHGLYYTLNRTWFTKGITLSVKFDRQERVEKIDVLENDKAILPYLFSLSDSNNQYKIFERIQKNKEELSQAV